MISDNWRETTLGDEVDLLTGYPFSSADYTSDSLAPRLLRGDNVVQGRLRWEDAKRWPLLKLEGLSEYSLRSGDVVLAMDRPWIEAGLKYASIQEEDLPSLLVQRVARLRAHERVNQRFLRYIIGSRDFTEYVLAIQTGTSVPHISGPQIKAYEFWCPPLDEQQAIGHILGALDDKIELNRRMNHTLEEMARAIFKSWFVDFDPVVAKSEGRQPYGMNAETAALFPSAFQDSELGPIPKGWRVEELRQRASRVQYGLTTSAVSDPVGPRFLRITDIQGGVVDWSSVPYCRASSQEHDKYKIQEGDVLIARTGASTGENIYVVDPPDAVFASYLVRLQFADRPTSRIVGAYLRLPDYFDYVASAIGGSAQPNASAQVLSAVLFCFPPQDVAKAFYKKIEPMDRLRAAKSRENSTLANIRDALLPKLLSGEIRVKGAGQFMEMAG